MLEYVFIVGIMLPMGVLLWGSVGFLATCAIMHMREYIKYRDR